MFWKKILFTLPCLVSVSSYALVEGVLDERHPISASLSTSSHNRISVEGGSVEKVIGDHSLFSVNLDPSTGSAFINVLEEISEQPTTLSVVTNSGLVQDILVTAQEGPSEQIILKDQQDDAFAIRTDVSHASTVDLLNQILDGKIPFGYGLNELEDQDVLNLPLPLSVETLKVLEGPFEMISVYEIENRGKNSIVLSSDALKKEGVAWVFLRAHELDQNEKTICLIGRTKE